MKKTSWYSNDLELHTTNQFLILLHTEFFNESLFPNCGSLVIAILTNTANLFPSLVSICPNVSTNVDLPAPGGPDRPILKVLDALPSCCNLCWWVSSDESNHWACRCLSGCFDSTEYKNEYIHIYTYKCIHSTYTHTYIHT